MVFDSDIKSSYDKISIENASLEIRSDRWGTLISCHQGEKKGGGEFLGGGELIGRIRYAQDGVSKDETKIEKNGL